MSPEDLAEDFEQRDYDYWLDEMLDNVPEDIDKREGSIIYDAVAPAAMMMAQQSLFMATIVRETYIKTASGDFLDYRATEHGTARRTATKTRVKASFTDDDDNPIDNVQIGDRFASVGEAPIFYTVTKINDDLTGVMEAEESGTASNSYIGQVLPVTPNDSLNYAEITEIIAPARDDETDDSLRDRLLNPDNWIAYGGNIADYQKMIANISDVGAVQVYPVWQGGGTVKLVIVDNDLMPASATLIQEVKDRIDPERETGYGIGLAPIDHKVTVVAPTKRIVNVKITISKYDSATLAAVKAGIQQKLENYFKSLRKEWSKVNPNKGRGYNLTVYTAKILSLVMQVEGVMNANLPYLNGEQKDIKLIYTNEISELPILDTVEVVANGS